MAIATVLMVFLDIFTDISGLSQHRGIHNSERHIKEICYSLGYKRLSCTCRTDHKDIGLLDIKIVLPVQIVVDPLVMIVDGNGKKFLCPVLTYHILVEIFMDLLRFEQFVNLPVSGSLSHPYFTDIFIASLHTFGTDAGIYSTQERDFRLAPAAEHTIFFFLVVFSHQICFFPLPRISSIIPYSFASTAVIQ